MTSNTTKLNPGRKFDFENFFDDLITKGTIEKEGVVVPGFKIKVRPLDINEQLGAESVLIANNPYAPQDTIANVRAISILCAAIVSINDVAIVEPGEEKKSIQAKREALHVKLMALPSHVIDSAYKIYIACIEEQKALYADRSKFKEDMQNF